MLAVLVVTTFLMWHMRKCLLQLVSPITDWVSRTRQQRKNKEWLVQDIQNRRSSIMKRYSQAAPSVQLPPEDSTEDNAEENAEDDAEDNGEDDGEDTTEKPSS